jgi:hypothetical protein
MRLFGAALAGVRVVYGYADREQEGGEDGAGDRLASEGAVEQR